VDYPNDQAPGAPVRAGLPEHGRVPKYYAVKARLDHLVAELGEGGAIPTERDLSEEYGVARETVRQALRELVLEGKLRRQGRGTVVAGPKPAQPLSLAGYTEGVRRQGRTPGRSLVTLDRFPCPDALAAETGLERGEPVWHLERVLLADDVRQVAVVGDTSYDVLTGVRAGAGLVAGVRTGAHGDEAFRAAGATHVLDSVAALPALLGGEDRKPVTGS
jgi:hypothetical protein